MKKLIATLLALVLMFSLNATALAEDPATGIGESTAVNNNSGHTIVSVAVNTSNLSVTVPISMTIVALVAGGNATVPTTYKIENKSAIPVKVDTIAVQLNNRTGWALKGSQIAANAEPSSVGVNDIYLSVNGLVLSEQGATEPTNKTDWNIEAGATKNLELVCSTSKLDQTTLESDLITITYVVSAGLHSQA